MAAGYAELCCRSNFSFLEGASHPQELVRRAHELGYAALALTDRCTLAGVVRAHEESKALGLHLIIGSELELESGSRLLALAMDRTGYGNLSQLITRARRRAPKGSYRLLDSDLDDELPHCLALWLPDGGLQPADAAAQGLRLKERFRDRLWIGTALHRRGRDCAWLARLQGLG
ncbi:MAG: PHP domain-containing protein, partial [Chromatiaceae bacterium]